MGRGLDVDLVKARFTQVESLCTEIESLLAQPKYRNDELNRLLTELKGQFRKVEINTSSAQAVGTLVSLGISPSELGILIFYGPDTDLLLHKALAGNRDCVARLIRTVRDSLSFWEIRVFGSLRDAGLKARQEREGINHEPRAFNNETPAVDPGVEHDQSNSAVCKAKIVLLLGAGASAPLGLPTMKGFWVKIKAVAENGMWDARDALRKIEEVYELEHADETPDLEDLLYLVDKYRQYYDIMFHDPVFGFTQKELWDYQVPAHLGRQFKRPVDQRLQQLHWLGIGVERLHDMLQTMLVTTYSRPLDRGTVVALYSPIVGLLASRAQEPFLPIFTTNYDPVIEKYCEFSGAALEHGFEKVGARLRWKRSRFAQYLPEAGRQNIVLYKLHGSLSWRREVDGIYDYGMSIQQGPGSPVVIHPTETKEYPYEEPFKTAYKYFEYCLRSAKVLVVVGYSFRDAGVRNTIQDAQDLNKDLRVICVSGEKEAMSLEKRGIDRLLAIPVYFEAGQNTKYLGLLMEGLETCL